MNNFNTYFKFPLQMWEGFDSRIYTADNKMAFDWLVNMSRETKDKYLRLINGESLGFLAAKEFWYDNGVIFCRILEGEHAGTEHKILRVRGWGMLTGVGGYHLDANVAVKIQDEFAEYCVNRLNHGRN